MWRGICSSPWENKFGILWAGSYQQCIPTGWDKLTDPKGNTYYVNTNYGESHGQKGQWHPPNPKDEIRVFSAPRFTILYLQHRFKHRAGWCTQCRSEHTAACESEWVTVAKALKSPAAVIKFEPFRLRCRGGHKLQCLITTNEVSCKVICNLCEKKALGSSISCVTCKFDACMDCYNPQPQSVGQYRKSNRRRLLTRLDSSEKSEKSSEGLSAL